MRLLMFINTRIESQHFDYETLSNNLFSQGYA